MPRKARILSESEVYHVMLRGNERKDIFLEEENKQRIIDTLLEKRKKSGFSLYAYCVMNNHAHFIIRTKDEPISIVFKRIGTSYAYYYNNKHNRVGHVFQDRFKSENIADDKYLITAVRYIHNNPVKARICQSAMNYKWSSIDLYLNYEKGLLLLPEISDVLSIFSDDISIAKTKFIEFSAQISEDMFIDMDNEDKKMDRDMVTDYINRYLEEIKLSLDFLKKRENEAQRARLIKELASVSGLSGRQISDIIGINRETVRKVIVSYCQKNRLLDKLSPLDK